MYRPLLSTTLEGPTTATTANRDLMINRRRLLAMTALAGSAVLLPIRAFAKPSKPKTPDDWIDWIHDHQQTVALTADNGTDERLSHRSDQPHLLASTIKVIHLSAYATAVAEGSLDAREQVRVGDWDAHHPYVSDGGAHHAAYTALGIACDDYGIAEDPDQTVDLDSLAAAMIDFSDNAATDYLRQRLGDPALHQAAAQGGWRRPDLRSLQGEVLQLMFPEYATPDGAPVPRRRRIGDRLARRFVRDLDFRAAAKERIATMPATTEEQWPWIRGHGRGTADELFGAHRVLASGDFSPTGAVSIARRHLERGLAGAVPEGALGVGFKGGSLPRSLSMGMSVRWKDGRIGTLALLLEGVDDFDLAHAGGFVQLGFQALTQPAEYEKLGAALA